MKTENINRHHQHSQHQEKVKIAIFGKYVYQIAPFNELKKQPDGMYKIETNHGDIEILHSQVIEIGNTLKLEDGAIVPMTDADLAEKAAWNAEVERQRQIVELKQQLTPLNEKLLQDAAGEVVPGIEDIRAEFRRIHGEIRALEGKPVRETTDAKTDIAALFDLCKSLKENQDILQKNIKELSATVESLK